MQIKELKRKAEEEACWEAEEEAKKAKEVAKKAKEVVRVQREMKVLRRLGAQRAAAANAAAGPSRAWELSEELKG